MRNQVRLRNPQEYRTVYESGRCFDGRFMTVFIRPNLLGRHRLGITASRKLSVRAVERNRAKRLLRETFRLSRSALGGLPVSYDWVLNARRSLLGARLADPLQDFQDIVFRVGAAELEHLIKKP